MKRIKDKPIDHKIGYKLGYNNPGQWNQTKLLKSNRLFAKGVIDGICQRKTDDANGIAVYKI